jgi:hypothetical protein
MQAGHGPASEASTESPTLPTPGIRTLRVKCHCRADANLLAVGRVDLGGEVLRLDLPTVHEQLAIELQIAPVGRLPTVKVIEILLVGEPTVKGEVPRDIVGDHSIHQLAKQDVLIAKLDPSLLALRV